MRINEIAKGAGVGVETVRFYESKGLITQPMRPQNGGYRDYPIELAHRIRFIRSAQQLGFSLQEVKELLALESGPQTQCRDVQERAEIKLNEVEEKIANLTQIKTALETLIDACPGKGPTQNCSILNEFRAHNQLLTAVGKGE